MGEIKSVKVDNWGVFFLQKLQNFFNKTDYCDLTLQFKDNSQLKVHRLVLSACTDYFNVLEQTCEVVDDALIMPNELQADVVVPIVNFMYTGTLEFELKMYGKLLRTAKEMNMTVLLKLLEAHRRTMEGVSRAQRPASPKPIRRRNIMPAPGTVSGVQTRILATSPQQQPQAHRILTSANAPQAPQRRLVQTKTIATNIGVSQSQLPMQFRQQIGSTSLIKTSPTKGQQRTIYETNYVPDGSGTTYETSIQFKQEQQDEYEQPTLQSSSVVNQSTSPFEQLRKGYNNNKRPASATFISPPAKKPNIEDVKEFSEQQRMRKQIAAEYGDDNEYEGMLDDDIHNDDDDDDATAAVPTSSTSATTIAATSRQQPQQQQHQAGPSIIIKQEPNEKPTIVVKDSANSKMNHAKIISEVLRQYPHLVKSNKNIKLKIMPNVGGQAQKIIVKKEQLDNITAELGSNAAQSSGAILIAAANVSTQPQHIVIPTKQSPQQKQQSLIKPIDKSNVHQQQPRLLLPKLQKIAPAPAPPVSVVALPTVAKAVVVSSATVSAPVPALAATAVAGTTQKRRIDSKTMHALIAQGAENTTGPWLCLRCGVNGRPISIPSYRGFRRHLINTHKETIDPALCEHCGWRSTYNRELHFHTQVEHKIKSTLYSFAECLMCTEIFVDANALNQHMMDQHPDENQQQCIYCNKIFAKEMLLYTHMKTYHKKQAIEDGIIDYSDDEDGEDAGEAMGAQDEFIDEHIVKKRAQPTLNSSSEDKKIKILSDISLPSASSLIKLEPSSEAAALTTMASGIATSIGLSETTEEFINTTATETSVANEAVGEPKFVTADGNEMVLTEEQRKEIMSQLNQEHEGGVVMVLNEPSFPDSNADDANIEDTTASHGEDAATTEQTGAESEENAENSANEEEYDDNNIYGEFVGGTSGAEAKKTPGLDESKGSVDNLEWAENLISAQELEEETEIVKKNADEDIAKSANKNEDINKKLQELTGDWTDDENDDEEQEMITTPSKETEEPAPLKSNEIEAMDTTTDHAEKEKPDEEQVEAEDNLDTAEKSPAEAESDKENDEHVEDDIDIALKGLHKENAETGDAETEDVETPTDVNDNTKEKDSIVAEESSENNEATEDDQNINESSKKNLFDSENVCEDAKEDKIDTEPTVVLEKEVDAVETEEVKEEIKVEKDEGDAKVESNVDDVIDINREMKKSLLDELINQNNDDDDEVEHEKGNTEEEQEIDSKQIENPSDKNLAKTPAEEEINEDNSETATSTSLTTESVIKEKSVSAAADAPSSSTKSSEDKVKTLRSEWGEDDDEDEEL